MTLAPPASNSVALKARSLDDLLSQGLSAQNSGDYGAAVALYEEALCAYSGDERAVDAAFTALRQVAISQFLIGRFFDNFGWSRARYEGFNPLGPQLSLELVLGRLRELSCGAQGDSSVGVSMKSRLRLDQFITDENFEVGFDDADNSELRLKSQCDFIITFAALESGDVSAAISALVSLIEVNPLCGSAHLLLGQLYYRKGLGGLALLHINLAFLHPNDFWPHEGFSITDMANLGDYKSYELIFYKAEFHAVPKTGGCFFLFVDGHNALYRNYFASGVSSGVRRTLIQMLPEELVSMARKLVYGTPLWRLIIKPVSFSNYTHSQNLQTVLTAIDQGRAAVR